MINSISSYYFLIPHVCYADTKLALMFGAGQRYQQLVQDFTQ
jgi:hypothetical protein